ncbi:hypothetical protein PROFUN_12707 [Planoprotostelium fungivorum]|uniref:PhoD-like phosphatase metallophosphatase domain-containing protein n=1 Tax=Planoprotostelium fungivorum TaxID=1890364 RepID=A0A2P6N6C7_9EUKA|nr:hypothetical protein PROFUN_12707 [Planoprotostelium fungivorum]
MKLFLLLTFFIFGNTQEPLKRLAFGSCNKQHLPQPIWGAIDTYNPDLWVWLGDVVYVDRLVFPGYFKPSSLERIQEQYNIQKNHSEYRKLISKTSTIGVWVSSPVMQQADRPQDDHDYGLNNAGGEIPFKDESQKIFLDFLDEPADSPRWNRKGVWGSYSYGPPGRRVKVILLDVRYWRDPLGKIDGDILGPEQWRWLDSELEGSDAQVHLIGSGTQILPYDKPFQEKWVHYPGARDKLFEMINKHKTPGVILLSGDVHYAEFLKTDLVLTYPLWELTSSGMTHTCATQVPYLCSLALDRYFRSVYQQTDFFLEFNFGTIDFHWDSPDPFLQFTIRDTSNRIALERNVSLSSLQSREKEIVGEVIDPKYMIPVTAESYRTTILPILLLILLSPLLCCLRKKRSNSTITSDPVKQQKKIKKDQ